MASKSTPRPWYKNAPLVSGLVLIVLGLGNWVTGTVRTAGHAQRLEQARLAASRGGITEDRPTAAEIEIARARMDFYHVVATGGGIITGAGFLLAIFGLARARQPQARKG